MKKSSVGKVSLLLLSLLVILSTVLSGCRFILKPTPTPSPLPPELTPTPTPTPLPPVPPQVIGYTPEPGEEVGLTAPVEIVFDQPMDQASVEEAFTIQPAVAGRFEWPDPRTLRFTPVGEGFARGRLYKIALDTKAKSQRGLSLRRPLSLKFTAVGYLEVTTVQPAPKTTEVPCDSRVTVMFNRPVVPLTSLDQQADLPQPLVFDPPVTGKGEWLNTSIYVFVPDEGFAPATTYTARVPAGLTDITGGVLAEDYTWSFTTQSPQVVDGEPYDGFQYAPPTTYVTVTFSIPMDHASAQEHFSLVNELTGEVIGGSFRWPNDTTMVFVPAAPLAFGDPYQAQVTAGALARDRQGGTLETYRWSFRVVTLPYVVSTDPGDGELDVEPGHGMEVRFSCPMDTDSVSGQITVIPEPTEVYTYWSDYRTRLYIGFSAQPATEYTVILGPDIADPYGHTLGKEIRIHYTTGHLEPMVYLNTQGRTGTYDAHARPRLYATYRNVSRLDVRLYTLPLEEFLDIMDDWWVWNEFRPDPVNLLREWSIPTDAPQDTTGLAEIRVEAREGEPVSPGLYCIEVTAPEWEAEEPERHLLVVSPLNLVLKHSRHEALVWVTSLDDGQPVSGLPITLYDGEKGVLVRGTTDEDGLAYFTFSEPRDTWTLLAAITAQPGDDRFGLVLNRWDEGISPWDFGLRGNFYPSAHRGYFYTERPIYRPGQTVYFKGILRRDDDAHYSAPEPQTIIVTIEDSQGREVYQEELPVSEMGTVHGELQLDEEASLGAYTLWTRIGEDYFSTSFMVAEYRKPEFQVNVTPDRDAYVQGETINVAVESTYYFGGPVADAEVRWAVLSRDYFFPWEGPGWYDFYDTGMEWEPWFREYHPFGELISEGVGRTDAQGRFVFQIPADLGDKNRSQIFTIEATVTDINGQETSSRIGVIVHQGMFYIGLAPRRYLGLAGQPQTVDVITVDWEGEPFPNVPLTVIAYQHKWYSVQKQADDGRFYWEWEVEEKPVYTATVTTDTEGKAELTFTPPEGGSYRVVAIGRDERENEVRSSTFLWVSSREYITWRRESHDRIELVADKKSYTPGETAHVLIPSPYEGPVTALLTIERGRILEHRVWTLSSNSEIVDIPLTDEHVPNVYVSVVLVQGRVGDTPASFKVGCVNLPVSAAGRELQIRITSDKDTYQPRDKVTYNIETTDHEGKPVAAELSLALVDKALLALRDPFEPPIEDYFYGERGLGIAIAGSLVPSIDRLNEEAPLLKAKGGGGAEAEALGVPLVRRRFLDTAYWSPVVRTDEKGRAQVEVTLPDNLTTWRMTARGVTADTLVGEARAEIRTTKPLLLRPVTPRFFVVGDKVQLAAVVHNNTDQPVVVVVSLLADGLEVGAQSPQGNVNVPPGDKVKVTWETTVQNVSSVRLLFSAEEQSPAATAGPFLQDAVELTLPVYPFSTPEVVATAGELTTDGERLEGVALPAVLDRTQGELIFQIDHSLAAGMQEGLKYLEHYPYECIEQTVSRFLPNLMTYRALQKLGFSQPELEEKLPKLINTALQRIYAEQHYDGGWGWWLSDRSSPFLTAYVLLGLLEAQRADFAVDEMVIENAVSYLSEQLGKRYVSANTEAFIHYVLSEADAGDLGRAVRLFEVRDKKQSRLGSFGRAFLAMALYNMDPDSPERVRTLLAELNNAAAISATGAHWEEEYPDYWAMNTDTRSTAIVILALTRLDPENAILPNAVRWLMVAREPDPTSAYLAWRTTQETAWAVMALTEYMLTTGELDAAYRYKVYLNGEQVSERAVRRETVDKSNRFSIPIAELWSDETNRVLFQRLPLEGETKSKGRLYYALYLRYFLPAEEIKARSRGIIISRQYLPLEMGEGDKETGGQGDKGTGGQGDKGTGGQGEKWIDLTEAEVGDVIRVRLTLVLPYDVNYLVVEDPLPAGCEGLDRSLKTTSVVGPEAELRRTDVWSPWGWGWWWFSHAEMHDEKVVLFASHLPAGTYEYTYLMRAGVPGTYHVMPAVGYAMYFPEVWGRSEGKMFTVR